MTRPARSALPIDRSGNRSGSCAVLTPTSNAGHVKNIGKSEAQLGSWFWPKETYPTAGANFPSFASDATQQYGAPTRGSCDAGAAASSTAVLLRGAAVMGAEYSGRLGIAMSAIRVLLVGHVAPRQHHTIEQRRTPPPFLRVLHGRCEKPAGGPAPRLSSTWPGRQFFPCLKPVCLPFFCRIVATVLPCFAPMLGVSQPA